MHSNDQQIIAFDTARKTYKDAEEQKLEEIRDDDVVEECEDQKIMQNETVTQNYKGVNGHSLKEDSEEIGLLKESEYQKLISIKTVPQTYHDNEDKLEVHKKEIGLLKERKDQIRMRNETVTQTNKEDEEYKLLKEDIEDLDLLESEDEAIVKDILDTLKSRNDSKEDDDSGYLDDFFENINDTDPNDTIVDNKLEEVDRREKSIELQNLGLERFNANLLKDFCGIEYLYLQDNKIASLTYDFFPVLNRLRYLDLRNNRLVTLPCNVCYHGFLEVLLLQNNCIQRVPKEIGSLSRLRGIQIAQNPLRYPAPSVVSKGPRAILEFLRQEWHQYEGSAAFTNVMADVTPARMRITTKRHTQRDEPDATQHSANSKRNNRKPSVLDSTSKRNTETDSAFSSGGDIGGKVTYENINYKNDTVCMYVSQIRPEKLKKNIRLPLCTEEIKDTSWSTSQTSTSNPNHRTKPSSNQSSQSASATKRRKKKLQHYSEILNPYCPLRSCSEPLDYARTQAMYLRKLVEINRKFVATTRDRMLQRMKDKEVLNEWRDDYRVKCGIGMSQRINSNVDATKNSPFGVYKEFERMVTRQELVDSQVEDKVMKSTVRLPVKIEDEERRVESKMTEIQAALCKIDSALKTHDTVDQGDITGLTTADLGKDRQMCLLRQISMMQKLQRDIRSLSKLNDTLL